VGPARGEFLAPTSPLGLPPGLRADFWAAGRARNPWDFVRWEVPINARGRYTLCSAIHRAEGVRRVRNGDFWKSELFAKDALTHEHQLSPRNLRPLGFRPCISWWGAGGGLLVCATDAGAGGLNLPFQALHWGGGGGPLFCWLLARLPGGTPVRKAAGLRAARGPSDHLATPGAPPFALALAAASLCTAKEAMELQVAGRGGNK
jgi:hypothetical protein